LEKDLLKSLVVQGSLDAYHTIVEVDFEKAPIKPSRKSRMNKKLGLEADSDIFNFGEVNPNIYNSPIYLYGEYMKLSRSMTQTPLRVDGGFKTKNFVSDFSAEFQKFSRSGPVKFMASGREDMDVRCLKGRPFRLEVSAPAVNLAAPTIEVYLHDGIDIINLSYVKKEAKRIVNCESPKKLYNLLIFSGERIGFKDRYDWEQSTPLRVWCERRWLKC
jgi:tRNA pseudouridine synthase 10